MTGLMTEKRSEQQQADIQWMERALQLAERSLGRVAPNPAVGAVLVRDGQVVGEGATEPPGGRHAEIVALESAGDSARGATLYVTLEPCVHYGRTPPCLDALLQAGIGRAVIAIRDPFHLVDGRSIQAMQEHGIPVELGIGADEATRINAGFLKRLRTGLPEVTVKYAMSLDGRIATRTGHSRWITGPEARTQAHIIRDRADAILVGIGTVLADNPQLTTRLPDELAGNGGPHHPVRVIVDSAARTPVDSAMLRTETPGTTVVAVTQSAPADRVSRLLSAGADVVMVPSRCGRVELHALLTELGERGVNSLMVEGGGAVLGSFFDAGLVDRVAVFIAPVLIGGQGAPSPIQGLGPATVDDACRLIHVSVRQIGDDMMITGEIDRENEHSAIELEH